MQRVGRPVAAETRLILDRHGGRPLPIRGDEKHVGHSPTYSWAYESCASNLHSYHPFPSPSRLGRGIIKPSPLAGEKKSGIRHPYPVAEEKEGGFQIPLPSRERGECNTVQDLTYKDTALGLKGMLKSSRADLRCAGAHGVSTLGGRKCV
jgi:hypothetical protein